jgi:hypothetical protein
VVHGRKKGDTHRRWKKGGVRVKKWDLRACLAELQLCKNSFGATYPRISTMQQLHCGSEILKIVWYSSRFPTICMIFGVRMSEQQKREKILLLPSGRQARCLTTGQACSQCCYCTRHSRCSPRAASSPPSPSCSSRLPSPCRMYLLSRHASSTSFCSSLSHAPFYNRKQQADEVGQGSAEWHRDLVGAAGHSGIAGAAWRGGPNEVGVATLPGSRVGQGGRG